MAARSALHYLKCLHFSHKRHFDQRSDHLKEMVVQLEKALLFVKAPKESDNSAEMSHLQLFYKRFENSPLHLEPSAPF